MQNITSTIVPTLSRLLTFIAQVLYICGKDIVSKERCTALYVQVCNKTCTFCQMNHPKITEERIYVQIRIYREITTGYNH